MKPITIFFAALSLLAGGVCNAAFSVESVGGAANNGAGGGITQAFTVTSANLLLVGVSAGDANPEDLEVEKPAWNGVALTEVPSSYVPDGNPWAAVVWYYMASPATGAHNITLVTAFDQAAVHIVSFIDADIAGTFLGTAVTGTNTTANPSITVGSAAGDIVVAVVANDNQGGTTKGSGTVIFDTGASPVGSDTDHSSFYDTASGATKAMSWTNASSGSGWAASGVAVKGMGGGGGGSSGLILRRRR